MFMPASLIYDTQLLSLSKKMRKPLTIDVYVGATYDNKMS
jgi:hypothetical protein